MPAKTAVPPIYVGRVVHVRISAEEGSKRVKLDVHGSETDMTVTNARAVMHKLDQAIRKAEA